MGIFMVANPLIDEILSQNYAQPFPLSKLFLVKSYLDANPDISAIKNALNFEALTHPPLADFVQMPFNAPLYILYSSGTTGAPKCIVHSAGGTFSCNMLRNIGRTAT